MNIYKKILQYFHEHWDSLPLDQVLFKIPSLHVYGTNTDIITNRCSNKQKNLAVHDRMKSHLPYYDTGTSLWMSPLELLTCYRFDIMARYIYAKYYLEKYQTHWHEDLYRSHLENWTQFYESEPLKIGFPAFIQAFNELIDSLKAMGLKWSVMTLSVKLPFILISRKNCA